MAGDKLHHALPVHCVMEHGTHLVLLLLYP
jgi:hypothetical protein